MSSRGSQVVPKDCWSAGTPNSRKSTLASAFNVMIPPSLPPPPLFSFLQSAEWQLGNCSPSHPRWNCVAGVVFCVFIFLLLPLWLFLKDSPTFIYLFFSLPY